TLSSRSGVLNTPPLGPDCMGLSPSEIAKIMPLEITTGVGTDMSTEFQAGTSTGLSPCRSTLNAMMLPCGVGPYEVGNFVAGVGGPQAGASSQRVPDPSSQ